MIDLILPGDGDGGIARVRFDTPGEKVNLLTEESLRRLDRILEAVEEGCAKGSIRGVAFTSAKEGIFLAGADVKAFVAVAEAGDGAAAAAKAREGQRIFTRIERLPVPTVAGINGVCVGGGLELALACKARIASDGLEVSIGLPEVKLGLIPGWGGTQRLPRLIGVTAALGLILTGRTLTGRQAYKAGIVDAVVPREGLERSTIAEARRLAEGGKPARRRRSLLDSSAAGRALTFALARRRTEKETQGRYPAPLAAIEAIRYGITRPIEQGLEREAEMIGPLIVGDVSRNLVRLFLSSRLATDGADTNGEGPAEAPMTVRRLGVIGAGTMGGGIAAVAAMSGIGVRLRDVNTAALERGMAQVRSLAESRARKKRLPRHEAARREALVAPTIDATGLGRCDLVIEAVVEDLEIKRRVLAEVEGLTGPSTIFATNTSSLSVTEIARGSSRPGRVLGLHFFNPVDRMPLVEVISTGSTEPSAVEAAVRLVRSLGKTPVRVKDTPGFIVNRLLGPYLSAALGLLREARSARVLSEIDGELVRFGMPMGPFTLLDQIGIDVAAKVSRVLERALAPRGSSAGVELLEAMVGAGLLGAKSGRGFYTHDGRKRGGPSGGLEGLLSSLPAAPAAAGAGGRDRTADLLIDPMIDEAARLLEEGAVERPDVIDLAMVFGTGFPPWLGGPLRYADSVGRESIAGRIAARGGTPSALLSRNGRFYS